MRLKLLPCAPCDLERVEEWINDEQKDGWRLKRFGILLPFLAFFVRDSAGGEYTISLEPPDDDGPERVCVLRNVGYVIKGKPRGAFDGESRRKASRRVGRNFIAMVFPFVLLMSFPDMQRGGTAGTVLLVGLAACFLAMIGAGLYFLLIQDPAKSPRARPRAVHPGSDRRVDVGGIAHYQADTRNAVKTARLWRHTELFRAPGR